MILSIDILRLGIDCGLVLEYRLSFFCSFQHHGVTVVSSHVAGLWPIFGLGPGSDFDDFGPLQGQLGSWQSVWLRSALFLLP